MTTETMANLNLAKTAKTIFENTAEVSSTRRRNYAISAAVGAVAGVGITALSDRATTGTLVATGIFGGLVTASVYNNHAIALHEDDASSIAIVGGVVGIETALFGCLANLLAGNTPEETE